MDLFTITCTTCKSRLKVRDEAAIGQILACPKCGGMVMVRPPDPARADPDLQDSQATVTSTLEMSRPAGELTLGDSAFEDVDELLSDAPPRVRTPAYATPEPTTGVRPRFVGAPPAQPQKPPATDPAAAVLAAAAAATLAPPPPGESDSAPLPPPDWSAPQPLRYWLAVAASMAVGVVLAFVAVTAAIHFFRSQAGTKLQTKATAAPATGDPEAPSADPQQPVAAPAEDPAELPGEVDDGIAPDPSKVSPLPPEPMPQNSEPTPPAAATDPLGFIPDERNVPDPQPANPDDPLARFDRLIGGDEAPSPATDPEGDPAAPRPTADSAPVRPAAPRPPPRDVNITARLADGLPGIETSGTPLADFLQLISDLSTIPITLEPDALPFARGATAETPVVLRAVNTTVGEALSSALQPLGLEHVTIEDQLVVRLIEPTPRPTFVHPVGELTDGDEMQLAELVEVLPSLIEPGTWGDAEEAGSITGDPVKHTLTMRHRRAVQAQVLLALEKLRTARGLPHVVRLDPAHFRLDTRWSKAKARLETPVSLNFHQPTRLVNLLQQLGQAAGVRMLVDWRSLAEAEWNPDAEATLIADKQPLGEALDSLLGPLDLSWRVVDGRTIEVVTPQRLARQLELEVYKVSDLLADDPEGERLVTDIRTALGEAAFESGGTIHFDAEGQCLLASLPQPKQRELEALLGHLRADADK